MKKLVLFAAFVAAVAFSACSGKTQETPAEAEAPATEEVAAPVQEEVATPDSTATEAPAEAPAAQ